MKSLRYYLNIFLNVFFIVAFFLTIPTDVYSDIVFSKKDGGENFEVDNRSGHKFRQLIHSNLYMSVKFDLVTRDVSNMVEPEGITTLHIAHYGDLAVKDLIKTRYIPTMYAKYQTAYNNISAKMTTTNTAITAIIGRPGDSTSDRASKWERVDALTDEMTTFYTSTLYRLLEDIDAELLLLYQERAYQSAELRNAEYEVRMTRIREIGLGCFSMAGSVTRIVFGDYASIVTLFIQAKDLFLWAKQSFSQNTDTLYDTYWELDEALNALARSVDEGRIQANISRVEKAYVPYLKITSKFTQASIDNIVDIQQFFQHIDDIEAALETLKREHPVNAQKAKSFTDLKIKLSALKRSSDQVNAVANSIKEALTATDTIRVRKNTLVTKKGMELKTLETIRKSNKLSKAKGFASIINISLPLVENIASTIGQILQ